jgi:hypothetical protein
MRRVSWEVGRDRAARLMLQAGLRGMTRGITGCTSVGSAVDGKFPDRFKCNFTAIALDQSWVMDLPSVST